MQQLVFLHAQFMQPLHALTLLCSKGPMLQHFVIVQLVQLLCRTVKLGWFDHDSHRSIVDDCKASAREMKQEAATAGVCWSCVLAWHEQRIPGGHGCLMCQYGVVPAQHCWLRVAAARNVCSFWCLKCDSIFI